MLRRETGNTIGRPVGAPVNDTIGRPVGRAFLPMDFVIVKAGPGKKLDPHSLSWMIVESRQLLRRLGLNRWWCIRHVCGLLVESVIRPNFVNREESRVYSRVRLL